MSIFRRESEPPKPSPAAAPARPAAPAPQERAERGGTTRIARGSTVVGQISGSTELLIDGKVEGEINLDSRLVIGNEGVVEGRIKARSVQVGGRVVGNVEGVERVEVQASGGLEGDVVAPRVIIAEGAFFKGKVEMGEKKPSSGQSSKGKQGGSKQAAKQPPK